MVHSLSPGNAATGCYICLTIAQFSRHATRSSRPRLDVTFARATLPTSGALLLPVEEGGAAAASAWAGLARAPGGAVGRALEAGEFKG